MKVDEEMFKLNRILDVNLLLITLALVAVGFVMVASATHADIVGITREVRFQVISFGLGFLMMGILTIIDYRVWGKFYLLIYALSIGALLLVYVPGLGAVKNNAKSWIDLKFMYFQTSEVAKIGFIIAFAKLLEIRKGKLKTPLDLLIPLLFIAPILYLLKEQPDLGTMLVFVFIFLGMLFVAGIDLKMVILAVIGFVVTIPVLYNSLDGYARGRIDAFLNPNDPAQRGYWQVKMSKITIGSGRLLGQGPFKGSFSANNFLPVQESDFIFAVLAEEYGFVGGIFVLGLYFLFFTRLIHVAFLSDDQFGTNIVIGVLFMFGYHVFQNIGMTMGIMPVTGVPLPFISYGGSSMLINMIGIGLVMSVYLRRKEKQPEDEFSKL